ncbi:Sugar phosphate isomerase/epimerase [Arthrobacter alpinus]|uniref:Sugar phosphate isomerase/epimerase n=1 Tax=Arthrobacter alpinus TaxID=656366 RepID=A0A1H5L8M0_9MICC|nr:TIM barrel protein [Arthrobacter alpinus]SEE73373.1 Sugar phosphate isomerase/epimerase [Arthrobacter alpinus]
MPLAFSTLGCPGDSLAEVIATAHDSGAIGLELRAAEGEFVHSSMTAAERAEVSRQLTSAGLSVLALASYVKVCAPLPEPPVATSPTDDGGAAASRGSVAAFATAQDPVLAELLAAVDLAADLSAGNGALGQTGAAVRVFPGAGLEADLSGEELSVEMAAADLRGAARLNAAAGHARTRGVTLLLETHDSHPRGQDIARILAHVDADAPVKVIWDFMHPWRHDEAPGRTAELLAESLAYPQFKDGVRNAEGNAVTLTLPGEGALPLVEMQALATRIATAQGIADPWVSLEWERTWHPELPPVSAALAALKNVLA